MSKPPTKRTRTKSLVATLRAVVDSLPSAEEKEQIRLSCVALRQFLNELEEAVAVVPSKDESATVTQTLQRLEAVLTKARGNPALGAIVRTKPSRKLLSEEQPLTVEEKENGRRVAKELEALPVDEIKARLLDEKVYSPRQFRAITLAFGFRSLKGFGRESLARQIAMKIANSRGYRALRGEQ